MSKHILLAFSLLLYFSSVSAQPITVTDPLLTSTKTDSIAPLSSAQRLSAISPGFEDRYQRKNQFVKSLSVSVPLITLGVWGNTKNNTIINKYEVREELQEHYAYFHTKIDNYLQFAPIVAVYGMNAMGFKGEHDVWNQTGLLLKSELIMNAIVFPLKKAAHIIRPDGSNYYAFPSGHTAQAFLSAEFLRKEYGKTQPWLAVGGYVAASGVAAMRMLNNKHWASDVLAGAGIGILSVNLAYLVHQNKWPLWNSKVQVTPAYTGAGPGIYMSYHLGK